MLDLGLFSGLGLALISGMNYFIFQVIGSSGASFNATLVSFPLVMLYFLYFSSELMMKKTLGKQLLGIEIRAEKGMKPSSEALFKRFVIKHGWVAFIFLGYITEVAALTWTSYAWLIIIAFGTLGALGKEKQAFHDSFAKLAVFPTKAPKADLSTLSKGKTEVELAEERQNTTQEQGTSNAIKRTARATLTKRDFPCAVELQVYVRDSDDIEEQIYSSFAQHIPNIHPNQVKLSDKKKGSYRICRVVMQFESPIQMEASYNSLAKLPNVVTTITVKSVMVAGGKGKKGKAKELLKAQASLS